jgi:DNA replication licensing factor MCM7
LLGWWFSGFDECKGSVDCSDVKPCMQVAVYACDACGNEVYQVIFGKTFTPKVECPSIKCVKNQVRGHLNL